MSLLSMNPCGIHEFHIRNNGHFFLSTELRGIRSEFKSRWMLAANKIS